MRNTLWGFLALIAIPLMLMPPLASAECFSYEVAVAAAETDAGFDFSPGIITSADRHRIEFWRHTVTPTLLAGQAEAATGFHRLWMDHTARFPQCLPRRVSPATLGVSPPDGIAPA